MVALLLEKGAEVDRRDPAGNTVLHYAAGGCWLVVYTKLGGRGREGTNHAGSGRREVAEVLRYTKTSLPKLNHSAPLLSLVTLCNSTFPWQAMGGARWRRCCWLRELTMRPPTSRARSPMRWPSSTARCVGWFVAVGGCWDGGKPCAHDIPTSLTQTTQPQAGLQLDMSL